MRGALAHHSAFWRRLAYLGARYGPSAWVRYSPAFFGAAFAVALPEARRKVRENLRWVRGPVDALREEREVLETFVDYARCLAESLAADRPEAAGTRLDVAGGEHLERALANGRGAVIVTAHVGPWDAAARLLRRAVDADVIVAMVGEPDAAARSLHDAVRAKSGVRVVHVGAHPLDALPLLRHLREGGVVAFQLDRGAPNGRVLEVELFGRGFELPEGPFRLAALAGAPIVPLFARRRGFFDYAIEISAPLELPARAGHAALVEAASRAARSMEAFIRSAPTQWFQFQTPAAPNATGGAARAPRR